MREEEGGGEGAEEVRPQLRFPKPVVLAANKVRGWQWVGRSVSHVHVCFVLSCFVLFGCWCARRAFDAYMTDQCPHVI